MTGINRQTAKRAYEKWKHSQSPEVLRDARKDVAAGAFREHMNSLITLATSLVTNLRVPSSPDMETNAEQFFRWLWQQDLLRHGVYFVVDQGDTYTMGDPQSFYLDNRFQFRTNELLFKSLQDHTRGEEVRWIALEQWKGARDKYVKALTKLREETSVVVDNYIDQERQTNLLYKIKEGSREDDPAKRITEAVLKAIWQRILEDRLEEESPSVETDSRSAAPNIVLRLGHEKFLEFTEKSIAERVTHICDLAVTNLGKGETVESLQNEVVTMKNAAEELCEMLNPVKLGPMILRTRCDLCPA